MNQGKSAEGARVGQRVAVFFVTGGSFALSGGQEFLNQFKTRWANVVEKDCFHAYALDYDDGKSIELQQAGYDFFHLNPDLRGTRAAMILCLRGHHLPDKIEKNVAKQIEGGDFRGNPRLVRLLLESYETRLEQEFLSKINGHTPNGVTRFYFELVFSPCGPTGSTVALFLARHLPIWFTKWQALHKQQNLTFKLIGLSVIPDRWEYRGGDPRTNGAVGYYCQETLQLWWKNPNKDYKPYLELLFTFSGLDYNPHAPCPIYSRQGELMDWLTPEFSDTSAFLLSGREYLPEEKRNYDLQLDVDEMHQTLPALTHCLFTMLDYPEYHDYKAVLDAISYEDSWKGPNYSRLRQALRSKWMRPSPLNNEQIKPLDEWHNLTQPEAAPTPPQISIWYFALAFLALLDLGLIFGLLWRLPLLTAWADIARSFVVSIRSGLVSFVSSLVLVLLPVAAILSIWRDSQKWLQKKNAYEEKKKKWDEWVDRKTQLRTEIKQMLGNAKAGLEASMACPSIIFPLIRPRFEPEHTVEKVIGSSINAVFNNVPLKNFLVNAADQGFYVLAPKAKMGRALWYAASGNTDLEWAAVLGASSTLRITHMKRFEEFPLIDRPDLVEGWFMRMKWILCYGPADSHIGWEKYEEAAGSVNQDLNLLARYAAYGEDLPGLMQLLKPPQ